MTELYVAGRQKANKLVPDQRGGTLISRTHTAQKSPKLKFKADVSNAGRPITRLLAPPIASTPSTWWLQGTVVT